MMLKLLLVIFMVDVHCSKNNTFHLISQFLFGSKSRFCIFLLCWKDAGKVQLQKHILSNINSRTVIIDLQQSIWDLDIQSYNEVTFILDFDCPTANKIIQKEGSKFKKFRYVYNWLVISNSIYSEKDIQEVFSSTNVRIDSRINFAMKQQFKNEAYRVFEVYKHGIGVDVQVNPIGLFEGEKFTYFQVPPFYESRKNMQGVLMRTGNRVNFSFTTEEDYANVKRAKGAVEFQTFNIQLFLILEAVHKFHHNTTLCDAWFGNNSAGTDAGIAKLLYEEKIDISTSGGFLRIARMAYYDFWVPVYKFSTAFLFKNPGKTKPGAEVLKPFSRNTWYAFILTAVVMGSLIYIAYWMEYTFAKTRLKYSFCTSMLIMISIISQQGSAIVPFRFGGRIIFLMLLIMSMMVYNYYTSSLVSSLLSSVPEAISTIKELYESNLKVAIEPQPYTFTYIIQQKDDHYINLLNSTKLYENGVVNILSPKEGIEKIKQGNYAYHTELATAYACLENTDQDFLCDLAEIKFIPDADLGLVGQKYSEFTELFQITFRKMQSSGILQREEKFWLSKKPVCLFSSRVKAVGLSELFLIYAILSTGIFLAVLIFLIELFLKKYFAANCSC